jgi:hypothetical protein
MQHSLRVHKRYPFPPTRLEIVSLPREPPKPIPMRVGVDGDRVLPILRAQFSYYATTNIYSLNDNANVRNCLNEIFIYPRGVWF